MSRETREIKIGNHTLVLNTYLTYGERIEINSLGIGNIELDSEGNQVLDPKTNQPKIKIDSAKLGEFQKIIIKFLVVKVDDIEGDKTHDAIMNMNESELPGLIGELGKAAAPLAPKKKEK